MGCRHIFCHATEPRGQTKVCFVTFPGSRQLSKTGKKERVTDHPDEALSPGRSSSAAAAAPRQPDGRPAVPPVPGGHGRGAQSPTPATCPSWADEEEPQWQAQATFGPQLALVSAGSSPSTLPHQPQAEPDPESAATWDSWDNWSRTQPTPFLSPASTQNVGAPEGAPTPGTMHPPGPPDSAVRRCLDRIEAHNGSGVRLDSQSACGLGDYPYSTSMPRQQNPTGNLRRLRPILATSARSLAWCLAFLRNRLSRSQVIRSHGNRTSSG